MCELATKRACGGLLQFKARGDFRIKVGLGSPWVGLGRPPRPPVFAQCFGVQCMCSHHLCFFVGLPTRGREGGRPVTLA